MAELDKAFLEDVAGGLSVQGKIVIVNCKNACNVRAKASDSSQIIGHAHLGKTFTFFGWSGSWAKILFQNRLGYVYKEFVSVIR